MLEIVSPDALDAFPVSLGQASECLQLVFGMDVREVDPSDHSYILVPILGLTYDGMMSGEQGVPKIGLLGVSLLHGDRAPEEEDKFHVKVAALVGFLLLKYCNKQPIHQAEMLEIVSKDYQDDYPVILGQASECMRLVFGMDVKEVDRSDHSYVLVNVLGLTCDGMLSGEHSMPKTGLLVLLLGVSILHGNRAPEEEVWETLEVMGLYAGQEHIIYGEPRELLTKVWVQEGYLEDRQVPGSDPACYEFPWGRRAHAEPASFKCWSICSGSGTGSWLPPWPCLKEL
ncbi:melanoma-associated antigen 9-like [Callorhinus ursinus]|uniref:melanoma-associated antigen 9-like n=1 Tax=Callorhinus ursinus TaxID=34884 RepID=UPI003CD024E1